jgi:general secretion pathway protein D
LRNKFSIFIVILSIIGFFSSREILLAQESAPEETPVSQPAESPQPVQPEPAPQPQPEPALQPQPEPAPQPQPEAAQRLQPPRSRASRQLITKRGEVSFNFDDADVFSVIQTIFGDVLQVNYIIDPQVKGRVNFRSVAPVAKEDVLPLMEVILRLNGIGIVEEGGLYRIVPIGDISKEPAPVGIGREPGKVIITGKALLQVIPVKYIESSEVVRVLTPFLSKDALIVDVPKSNYIIVADTDTNVKRLLQLVEVFDSELLKKIKPRVFVYPVQNSKAKDVATMLQQIFLGAKPTTAPTPTAPARPTITPRTSASGQSQPGQPTSVTQQVSMGPEGGEALVSEITKIFADEVTNTIIILATEKDYELIAETIKKIDIVPRQVVIEGLIARVDLTDKLDFGMQWTIQNDLKIKGLKPFTRDINISGPLKLDTAIPTSTFTFTAYDAAGQVKLLLQSLATEGKAKILAAPHILVSDNREARIQVGSQIPLATQTSYYPTGTEAIVTSSITSTVQYKDIGIILKVKPQVNDSGLVSLELSQEVSSLGENVAIAGQAFASINKTEASTNLVAQDGETIIIGGLIREDVTKSRSGIPFLSRIPILGYLFGSTINESTRNELIILLTPHVIRNQQEAGNVTTDYLDRFEGNTDMKVKELTKEKKEKEQKEQTIEGEGSKDSKHDMP